MKLNSSNSQQSSTFCILPWIHVSTKTNGEMRLCCTTCASSAGKKLVEKIGGKLGVNRLADGQPVNLSKTSLSEAWNSGYMRDVRLQMLRGEIPPSCAKCFQEEKNGVMSKRQWETEYWSKSIDIDKLVEETDNEGKVPDQIRYFDLRLGHKCNLKCSMCSPHDSSSWINDWDTMMPSIENTTLRNLMVWPERGTADGASYDWYKNKNFWNDLDVHLPSLRQIYFAGGEPLLIDEHYQLLERAIELGHASEIELRYNSNGTHLPEKIFPLWEKFKKVRFGFSLDSFGERNHYIRFPAKWAIIEKNLRRLDQTPDHIEVTLACAVQILNIFDLPEFIRWKLDQGFRKINSWPNGAGLINFHLVYHPALLNIRVLPEPVKEAIALKFENFETWILEHQRSDEAFQNHPYGIKRLRGLVKFMMSEDWSHHLPAFTEYIGHLDKIRNTSFADTFPELSEALEKSDQSVAN